MRKLSSVFILLSSIAVASCGSSKLNEDTALQMLKDDYGVRAHTKILTSCPVAERLKRVRVKWNQDSVTHPCSQYGMSEKFAEVFRDKYGILAQEKLSYRISSDTLILNPNRSISIFTGVDREKLSELGATEYITDTEPNVHEVKMFDYEFSEIVGIRQSEEGGLGEEKDCEAIVEYTYIFFNKAPWADAYIENLLKPKPSYEACFQKYDDGWRIKKKI